MTYLRALRGGARGGPRALHTHPSSFPSRARERGARGHRVGATRRRAERARARHTHSSTSSHVNLTEKPVDDFAAVLRSGAFHVSGRWSVTSAHRALLFLCSGGMVLEAIETKGVGERHTQPLADADVVVVAPAFCMVERPGQKKILIGERGERISEVEMGEDLSADEIIDTPRPRLVDDA